MGMGLHVVPDLLTCTCATCQVILSSTYDLRLASGCYSDEKGDKSNRRRYNSERRRCKSNVGEEFST